MALIFIPKFSRAGYFLLNWLMLELFPLLLVLPHELGHAVVGRVVGFRVFHVIVGLGKSFYKGRLMGFNLEIKTLFLGGVTIAAPKSSKFLKIKYALFIFAGPFVSIVLGWVVFLLIPRPIWPRMDSAFEGNAFSFLGQMGGQKLMPLQVLLLANLFILVASLWPRKVNTAYGKIASDGLALLKAPFMKPEVVRQLLSARYLFEASEAFHESRYEAAQKWSEDGLVKHPENDYLKNYSVASLLRLEAFQKARDLLVKQLQSPPPDPMLYAVAFNNLAWADLMIGAADLLQEADECSRKAIEKTPWQPAIQGTRGAVLVELGRIEEGVALLNQCLAKTEDKNSKALLNCSLAIAE